MISKLLQCLRNWWISLKKYNSTSFSFCSLAFLYFYYPHVIHEFQYNFEPHYVEQIRMKYTEDNSYNQHNNVYNVVSQVTESALCKFFIIGTCNKGMQCCFSHSLQARRPPCRFFHTFQVIVHYSCNILFINFHMMFNVMHERVGVSHKIKLVSVHFNKTMACLGS